VRFVSLDILVTGVLAFECALSSLTSAFVHSRRTALPFFFGFVTFKLVSSLFDGGRVLTHRRAETTKQKLKIAPSRQRLRTFFAPFPSEGVIRPAILTPLSWGIGVQN